MPPVRQLPAGYVETKRLLVTDTRLLLWLNVMGIIPLVLGLAVAGGWWLLAQRVRGPQPGDFSWVLGLLIVVLVLPLHEGLHAAAIFLVGHRARFGAKLDKGLLYATADGALFRRAEFVAVALAPLAVISLGGLALMLAVPDSAGFWIGLAVAINASSSIGDLWMTAAVLRSPPGALVRDEEDGIRIYAPGDALA